MLDGEFIDYEDDELLETVEDWARHHKEDFDATYLKTLRDAYLRHAALNSAEREILENIVVKYDIQL